MDDIEERRRLIDIMKALNKRLRYSRQPGRYVIKGGRLKFVPDRPQVEERERSTSPEIPVI